MNEDFNKNSVQDEPTAESVERSVQSLTESMLTYDYTVASTQELRQSLINKIVPAALELDLKVDPGTDPDVYASQVRLIEQARQLLNDREKSAKDHVTTKLKKSDLDQQKQSNLEVAKLLQQIKLDSWAVQDPNRPLVQTEEELAEALDQKCAEKGCTVLDTELTKGEGMLPTKAEDSLSGARVKE